MTPIPYSDLKVGQKYRIERKDEKPAE